MNRETGLGIGLLEHIRQSVADILTTPIGSRVMRREYGSQVPDLIDQPTNGDTVVRLYAATAIALMRWEPRVRLTRVQFFRGNNPGSVTLALEGTRVDTNEQLNLQVPLRFGASA
ncbi:baseplate assembly protein [Pseudomonas sp. BN415]|uniref:GPW/gp25 family protein n=1 Tax=Pseudomonas sp. BN415 TaxID=2567889 RepID=UPI00245598A8|nr:GPW/gp25 family protein [Pseudomonas sp. BN415]MDH4585635.1 baseplate assembly protein [Pseudomonas sp. BN415]